MQLQLSLSHNTEGLPALSFCGKEAGGPSRDDSDLQGRKTKYRTQSECASGMPNPGVSPPRWIHPFLLRGSEKSANCRYC